MNDFELSPDDPRLTAYALGELDGDERAAVEAAVRRDPELRDALEEIRATAAQVEAALAAEALEPIESIVFPRTNGRAHPNGRAPVNGARTGGPVLVEFSLPEEKPRLNGAHKKRRGPPKVLRFPQMYFIAGGLAAACFTVVALRHPAPLGPTASTASTTAKRSEPLVITQIAPAPAPANAAAIAETTPAAEATTAVAARGEVTDADAPARVPSFVQVAADPTQPITLPEVSVAEARPGPTVPAAAAPVEMLAGGLPLLQQAKAIENAALSQNLASENTSGFAPLAAPRVPFVSNPLPSLTVGLPREAALPLLPPTIASGGVAASGGASAHAVVRQQEAADVMLQAELRAAGSPAEFARLMANAKKQAEAERRALAALAPAPKGGTVDRPARLAAAAVSRGAGVAGEVRIAFTVETGGALQALRIVSATDPRLAERAIETLRACKFEPAAKGGRLVASRLEATVAFRASGEVDVSAVAPTEK